jgi:hypothetical protein
MRRGLLTWAGQNVDGVSDTDGFAGGSNHCSEDMYLMRKVLRSTTMAVPTLFPD